MEMDRRHVLDLLGSGLFLSAAPSIVSAQAAPAASAGGAKAALLLPVSGASAALGLSMQRSVALAQGGGDEKTSFPLFDTSDTPEGAGRAAASALQSGAAAILGPVFGRQLQAVAAAVGQRIPVISFSNSYAAADSGIFTFGITPSQSVSAILQYARARGVRRVALVGSGTPWSEQSGRAAQRLAPEIGLELLALPTAQGTGSEGLPDAALLTGEAAHFTANAPGLQARGVQVLGTMQALDRSPEALAATEGAWISAPEPAAFASFAAAYERSGGTAPGTISALALDAARILQSLAAAGKLNREGLLGDAGFPGFAGAVRFRADGRCVRELAILHSTGGSLRTVGRKAGL
jgi:ABC-type branched-subunit amino acid transport system substrate-binding protein